MRVQICEGFTVHCTSLFSLFLSSIELSKSINTDEAAAMGAVYQAAHLGKGFKVLTFGVKEANVYPIVVSII